MYSIIVFSDATFQVFNNDRQEQRHFQTESKCFLVPEGFTVENIVDCIIHNWDEKEIEHLSIEKKW